MVEEKEERARQAKAAGEPGKAIEGDSKVGKVSSSEAGSADAESPDRGQKKDGGEGQAAPGAAGATPNSPAAAAAPAKKKGATVQITSSGTSKGAGAPIGVVAVGEKVNLSTTEDGWWEWEGQQIGVGQTLEWKAPNVGKLGNLRFENNAGVTGSKPFDVRAPKKAKFTKLGEVPSAGPDMAGVGMNLNLLIEPTDVSFGHVSWLERPGPASGSGYFATYGLGKLFHHPRGEPLPMGAANNEVIDNAFSRDKPKLEHPDGKGKRWWAGSFAWSIPNAYKIGDFEQVYETVIQTFTITDDGTMTVTKGGCSTSAKPASVTEGDQQRKFKNVGEAKTYLTAHGRGGAVQAALNFKRDPKSDPESVKLISEAVRSYDIIFRAVVTSRKNYAWGGTPDRLVFTANGQATTNGNKKILAGNGGDFDFAVNSVLNLTALETAPIALNGYAEAFPMNHSLTATIPYPYNESEAAFNDHYSYKTALV